MLVREKIRKKGKLCSTNSFGINRLTNSPSGLTDFYAGEQRRMSRLHVR